jgi:hypothetical protein
MKIRPMGADLSHVNGRTDITKLIVAFLNFAKAPKSNVYSSADYDSSLCDRATRRSISRF